MDKRLVPWVLFPFFGYSSWVVVRYGYFGFLTLAFHEPWAMQMLLDLVIALFLVSTWMRRDARERGIPVTPYLVLVAVLGSIGALAYLVHRSMVDARATNEG